MKTPPINVIPPDLNDGSLYGNDDSLEKEDMPQPYFEPHRDMNKWKIRIPRIEPRRDHLTGLVFWTVMVIGQPLRGRH